MEDLFLGASFDGLGTHLQIPHWITKTLDRICQSAATHYTADVDYDIRLGLTCGHVPLPDSQTSKA